MKKKFTETMVSYGTLLYFMKLSMCLGKTFIKLKISAKSNAYVTYMKANEWSQKLNASDLIPINRSAAELIQ
jgi:hypothetical protein